MIRHLTAELGLTGRCAVLIALALTVLILAMVLTAAELYGAAAVLAFLAGTTWDREIRCDACAESLEER
jgi:TRAP-type C4-dicarboxylate transport system permease large subunit